MQRFMTKSSKPSEGIFSQIDQKQIKDILLRIAKFKSETETILQKYAPLYSFPGGVKEILEFLILRFHSFAKQIQKRQRNREPFIIRDEYDVQDLLHSLLRIHFDDVRPEEYCPSYAGKSARMDFFLKK